MSAESGARGRRVPTNVRKFEHYGSTVAPETYLLAGVAHGTPMARIVHCYAGSRNPLQAKQHH